LLDEPLAALDANLRHEMQLELKQLQRQLGITFIFVTHDQQEALALSDRIALLRQGRIEQLDTPQAIYGRPRTAFAADFIGRANLIEAVVESWSPERLVAKSPDGLWVAAAGPEFRPVGSPVTLIIRPEHVRLSEPGAAGRGRVTAVTYKGFLNEVVLALPSGHILTAWTADHPPLGGAVGYSADPDQVAAL
jgi:spermidine/putrescine transport system ATP-binding protein